MKNFFTDRHGGVSHGDFASWNLATHVGDDLLHVSMNQAKLREQVGEIVVMSQVHGDNVVVVEQVPSEVPVADALITSNPNLALVVMVADCIPLLLRSEKLVAAVHVGRAGLVNSIALKTIAMMRELGAIEIVGFVGPAICGSCYEVPQELQNQVLALHPTAKSETKSGTPALDLTNALISALAAVDVSVTIKPGCTFEDENLFSFRRNQITGRQAGVIKL
jgi:YfiH family protein